MTKLLILALFVALCDCAAAEDVEEAERWFLLVEHMTVYDADTRAETHYFSRVGDPFTSKHACEYSMALHAEFLDAIGFFKRVSMRCEPEKEPKR